MSRVGGPAAGLLALSVALFTGCSTPIPDTSRSARAGADSTVAALPIRTITDAMPRVRPADFRFRYSTLNGTLIDSEAGTYTDDQVDDPDTTIGLVLTPAELDTIYATMLEIGFFDLAQPHPEYAKGVHGAGDPHTIVELRAWASKRDRWLTWTTNQRMESYRTPEWEGLLRLVRRIVDIVEARPEVRALPAPDAGHF